jgi:hypothetical protein
VIVNEARVIIAECKSLGGFAGIGFPEVHAAAKSFN